MLREIGMLKWVCHNHAPPLHIQKGPKGLSLAKAMRNLKAPSSVHNSALESSWTPVRITWGVARVLRPDKGGSGRLSGTVIGKHNTYI